MEQDTLHLFRPIKLISAVGERDIVIESVEDAARELLTEWPDDDGENYYVAVKACFDCLHDNAATDSVRRAFVRAAVEAGILVEHLTGH